MGDFQNSLANIGCEYWGKLYENIFNNEFYINKTELERRLSVPKDVQQHGAKAVSEYLLNLLNIHDIPQLSEYDFNLQINENLNQLDHEKIMFFTWLCAVRVLPFLGAEGSFEFWDNENRLKHLYAVLNALDVVYKDFRDNYFTIEVINCVKDAFVNINDTNYIAAYNTVKTVYTASEASDITEIDDAFKTSYFHYANSTVAYAINAARYYDINIQEILLEDIKYIESNNYNLFNNGIKIYGKVWHNFQRALKNVGCGYWGKLYKDLLKNRFNHDKESIERRLSVPIEIKQQGAKAVADWLENTEFKGSENLNEARIVLLGEKGVGKTSLKRLLINPLSSMPSYEESTFGVDISTWAIKNGEYIINTHIWDFTSHVITHAAHRCFLSERCLYIIVYNSRAETQNRLDYWLDHVKIYGGNAPVRILINIFNNHISDIPENTLKSKYPFIIDFVYLSINDDKNELEFFRNSTAEYIINNPLFSKQRLPSSYIAVKNALEKRLANNFIDLATFEHLADEYSIGVDEREHLLNDFHSLGICLWYKEIKKF